MAQTIKIKRSTGSAAPSTLASGELAYSAGSDTFYVGSPSAANTPIVIGPAIKNNAGTPVLATGVTAAEIRSLISVDVAGTDNSSPTNITVTEGASTVTIASSTGSDDSIAAATTSLAGVMSAADKQKLDGIDSGAQVNVATNLGNSASGTALTITSSTGSSTNLPAATTTAWGVMTDEDKTKLDGIEALADVTDATNVTSSLVAATAISAGNKTTIQTNLGVDPAGTDNSTNVTLGATVSDVLSITGQAISGVDAGAADAVIGWDDSAGKLTYLSAADARTALGLGSLATLSSVNAATITDNSVGAAELNVSGNGTAGQALVSDGDGTFSWSTISVTDNDVNVANLTARLPQITESVTIGDATDVTITTSGNLVVTGDLTVSGTTTTVNTETINLADNIITVNSNYTGSSPTENGGIEVERGTLANTALRWNETNDRWEFTNDGSTYYNIPLSTEYTNNVGDITGVTAGNGLTGGGASGSVTLNVGAGTGITVAADTVSVDMTAFNTDALDEGTTNLYHTTARARAAISGGTGITYSSATGVISLSDTGYVTGVTAGTGLSGGGTEGTVSLALDFSELTDMTSAIAGTTEFILQDGTTESRKAASEIDLSAFNNDSGWTSNTGTVTSVAISSTDGSISGTGTITTSGTFDLEVATIDGGTY